MKTKKKSDLRKVCKDDEENKRLSLSACRKILGEEAESLSDKKVIEIRDYLYRLAAMTYEDYQNKTSEAPVINLEHYKTEKNEKESHYLRAG